MTNGPFFSFSFLWCRVIDTVREHGLQPKKKKKKKPAQHSAVCDVCSLGDTILVAPSKNRWLLRLTGDTREKAFLSVLFCMGAWVRLMQPVLKQIHRKKKEVKEKTNLLKKKKKLKKKKTNQITTS